MSKSDTFIKTVDSQKNIVVEYKKNNNKIKSKGWFLVDKNLEQQFMIPSNKLVRVFCRSVINDKPEENYSVSVHENGQWIGNYMFEELKTENNSKIVTDYKKIKDKNLSKTRSFYLNIPDGKSNYSYYTFSLPKDSNKNDKVLIKIVEYEKNLRIRLFYYILFVSPIIALSDFSINNSFGIGYDSNPLRLSNNEINQIPIHSRILKNAEYVHSRFFNLKSVLKFKSNSILPKINKKTLYKISLSK